MKSTFFILSTTTLLLISCNENEEVKIDNQKTILPGKGQQFTEEINYNAFIGNIHEKNESFEIEELTENNRQELLEQLIKNVFEGKTKAYLPIPGAEREMTAQEIKEIQENLDTLYHTDPSTGEMKVIPLVNKFSYDGITHFKFKEKWFYDKTTNHFSKEVIAVCPLEQSYDDKGEVRGLKALFWIYFDNNKPKENKKEKEEKVN